MDSKKTAQKIRKLNSGASNFEHIEHGSTRRQLSLDEENRYSGYSKERQAYFYRAGQSFGFICKNRTVVTR